MLDIVPSYLTKETNNDPNKMSFKNIWLMKWLACSHDFNFTEDV